MTLSFDRAQAAHEPVPCAQCTQPIDGQYWTWQARSFCQSCREVLDGIRLRSRSREAFLQAALKGGGVAFVCGVGYAMFVHLTKVQAALITIGIAVAVARVVRAASAGVGGRRYQVLAVALTYAASTMGYAPGIIDGLREAATKARASEQAPSRTTAAVASSDAHDLDNRAGVAAIEDRAAQAEAAHAPANAPASRGERVVAATKLALVCLGIMLTAPFLEITESPIGVVIVAIGLWQAWRLSRGVPMEVEGPFDVRQRRSAA